MKKFTLMFAVAAILALSSFGASAYTPDESGSYSITYNVGAENKGQMYGMVAISGTGADVSTTNTDDIVYIDQATADEEGNITFTGFAPMGVAPSDPTYVESTVFIGGPSYTTAKQIGVLETAGGNETEYAISGTVSDTVSTKAAKVTVIDAAGETVESVDAGADGSYSVSVGEGTYSVKFTKDGFCSYTYTGVAVAADVALPAVDMTALAGDLNTDGEVKLADLQALLADYNKMNAADFANALSDLNLDGEVKLADLQKLLGGYNGHNETVAYVAAE